MPKKAGVVFIAMGAVLFISALLLFIYNRQEENVAGEQSAVLLESVQNAIEEQVEPVANNEPVSTEITTSHEADYEAIASEEAEVVLPSPTPRPTEMTEVAIDGYSYVGFVTIPALGVELPIMSEWDYVRLKIAPCRQFGNTWTDDLVIAAHNYETHFGYLSELEAGDSVTITDMDGVKNDYVVSAIETLAPTKVDEVQNSGYELVLYTCTYGGATRVVVFCERAE